MNERMLELAEATNEKIKASNIQKIQQRAKIPKGVEGECDYCGNHSVRLIFDACAKCRDRYKLG